MAIALNTAGGMTCIDWHHLYSQYRCMCSSVNVPSNTSPPGFHLFIQQIIIKCPVYTGVSPSSSSSSNFYWNTQTNQLFRTVCVPRWPWVCKLICLCACVQVGMCVCFYVYTVMCIYMHAYACMHLHMCVRTCVLMCVLYTFTYMGQ